MNGASIRLSAAVVATIVSVSPARAQIRPYLVAEGGLERRQSLPDGAFGSADVIAEERTGRRNGFAYGVAAGAELPLSTSLFAGVEAGVARSTVATVAVRFRGVEVVESVLIGVSERTEVNPRWSYSVTGRLGVNLSRSAAIYGLAGVGGERVRVAVSSDIDGSDDAVELRTKRSYEGPVFGGGARLFLSDRIGARLEYRRIETDDGYDPERLTAGLVFRL